MAETVMAIGAHPDDVELGAGGTLAAFSKLGFRTVIVDLTNGEPTPLGSPEIRAAEAERARVELGVDHRVTLDLPNRELMDSIEGRKKLAAVIREYQPRILFTHHWDDGHPDHIQACALTIGARFYSKLTKTDLPFKPFYPGKVFHYYAFHMRIKAEPAVIFDVSKYIEQKIEAVRAYRSQFVDYETNQGIFDLVRQENAYWGKMAGCEFGEAFSCKEHIKLVNPQSLLDA